MLAKFLNSMHSIYTRLFMHNKVTCVSRGYDLRVWTLRFFRVWNYNLQRRRWERLAYSNKLQQQNQFVIYDRTLNCDVKWLQNTRYRTKLTVWNGSDDFNHKNKQVRINMHMSHCIYNICVFVYAFWIHNTDLFRVALLANKVYCRRIRHIIINESVTW